MQLTRPGGGVSQTRLVSYSPAGSGEAVALAAGPAASAPAAADEQGHGDACEREEEWACDRGRAPDVEEGESARSGAWSAAAARRT